MEVNESIFDSTEIIETPNQEHVQKTVILKIRMIGTGKISNDEVVTTRKTYGSKK